MASNEKPQGIKLSHAVLFETNALPTKSGKLINLKGNLSIDNPEGKQMGLELTLIDSYVKIKTTSGSGFIPVTAFKMLVPLDQ